MTDAAAPPVAVVTAARNMEKYIGETIGSVLQQTLTDFEMIVIDDGSSDATAATVTAIADPRVRLLSISSAGVSAARNRGLNACRAPLVVFLDADDLLLPDALGRMMASMAAHPHHVACFGHHVKVGEDGAPIGSAMPSALKQLPTKDTLRHLLCRNVIVNGGAICIRTEAARRVGGYHPTLRFSEDWEFWCRLAALSDFVAMADSVVLKWRQRRSSTGRILAGSPLRPNLDAIDVIYSAPALRDRFTARELHRCRRLAEIDVHWTAARNQLREGQFGHFALYLLAGALRYPYSVFQLKLIYLFIRGCI